MADVVVAPRLAEIEGPSPARRPRAHPLGRAALRLAPLAVGSGVAALGVVGWIGAERAIHPAVAPYTWEPAAYPHLHPQDVTYRSRVGATISGRFFPGRSGATIVVSHGWADTQQGMLPWVEFLHAAGYSVFTYDMRCRGQSTGAAVTLGALEQFDLISAVDHLAGRPDVDASRIGALGISMGGSTSILAAAQDTRIRAVVTDCAYGDVRRVIATSFQRFIGLPAFPFAPITVLLAEWRTGVRVDGVRPVDKIGLIGPRPVLLIHGLDDVDIPPIHSVRNFEAAHEPKEIWWVSGAGHGLSREVAGAAYAERVVSFFRRHLGLH
jgi:dipeptidyl aminopeptidase/acylaminoacyl peptidase